MNWLHPNPFLHTWTIGPEHIDHYHHVNNVAYVKQLEVTSWSHSNQLGLTIEQYQEIDRGMAISRHEINYLAAAHEADVIDCATWIVSCDSKIKLSRQFQFIRRRDKATLLTAKTDFVCIELSTGLPKRMPKAFSSVYGPACISAAPELKK